MLTKKYLTLIIILLIFMSGPLFATNGMRMIGLGPVQNSMGGVSVGLPLDAASVLTNPAGMSVLPGRIDFGASYFKPTVEYKAAENTVMGGTVVAMKDETMTSDRGASPIPAFGLIVPVTADIKFGIGAYGIAGMGVDYPKNLYGGITYTSYSQMRFSPGISYKINDMVSAGAVVNVMYATMEFNSGAGFGQSAHMGASSFGYGATVGILVRPSDALQIGLAYETRSVFQDFNFNTPTMTESIEFNQPQSATVGLSVKPFEGLVLGVDVQWIRWSETNGKNLPEYTQSASSTIAWNMDWEDQIVYKFGIQYTISPMLVVRAGYNYGKMPLNSDRAFENINFPAISEHHFTAGIGVNFTDKLALNIGGMYSPEAKLTGSNSGIPPAAGQGIASYETRMSQYSIDVGISYIF